MGVYSLLAFGFSYLNGFNHHADPYIPQFLPWISPGFNYKNEIYISFL
jgi:hypothetical protein